MPERLNSNPFEVQRKELSLDQITQDMSATDFIARFFPLPSYHVSPQVIQPSLKDWPQSFSKEWQRSPLLDAVYVLNPNLFPIFGIRNHFSSSASLVDQSVPFYLLPSNVLEDPSYSQTHFNLSRPIINALPLAFLVDNGSFVWMFTNDHFRQEMWDKAADFVFNPANHQRFNDVLLKLQDKITGLYNTYDNLSRQTLMYGRFKGKKGLEKEMARLQTELNPLLESVGISGEWKRLLLECATTRALINEWTDRFYTKTRAQFRKMENAYDNLPDNLRILLDHPFPLLYQLDTNAQAGLPGIPHFFIDSSNVTNQIYPGYTGNLYDRQPHLYAAAGYAEGSRIVEVVIPDSVYQDTQTLQVIQNQIKKMNPQAKIIPLSTYFETARPEITTSCDDLNHKRGLTEAGINAMMGGGNLIRLVGRNVGIGGENGVFAVKEIDLNLLTQKQGEIYQQITGLTVDQFQS